MATQIEDDLKVFRLALLTEDRDRGEQAAMMRVGKRLEKRWNKETVTNNRHRDRHPERLKLQDEIRATLHRG